MTSAQQDAPDTWRARHPVWAQLILVIMWLSVLVMISMAFWPLAMSLTHDWDRWKLAYEMEEETWLRLELPIGPPVTVDTYLTLESCKADRANIVRQAYQRQQAIPPLSCTLRYPGWRRVWQTWRTMSATIGK
jgi:hypothetical protein